MVRISKLILLTNLPNYKKMSQLDHNRYCLTNRIMEAAATISQDQAAATEMPAHMPSPAPMVPGRVRQAAATE